MALQLQSGSSTGGRGHTLKVRGLQVVLALAIGAVWLYMQGPGDVSPIILPPLQRVAAEIVGFLVSAELYRAILSTTLAMVVSFLLAALPGIVVGFWGARRPRRAEVLEPLLVWGYLVPTVLIYPVLLLWFGFGIWSKVAYAFLAAFFPIAFNCLRGFRRVDKAYINVGRAFGASPRQLDWSVKLRAGIALAAAGLRIGAALCMIVVIVAEMLASPSGLGYLIAYYSGSFNTAKSYAIVVVVLAIVGVFQMGLKRIFAKLGSEPAGGRRR